MRTWPWSLAVKEQVRQACLWFLLPSGESFPRLQNDSNVCSARSEKIMYCMHFLEAVMQGEWLSTQHFPCSCCVPGGLQYHHSWLTELKRGGLISFTSLTSQVIKMHPVMPKAWKIIWCEFFFFVMSSYGIKHLRDRGSITYHDRLLEWSIILAIKNVHSNMFPVWICLALASRR